MFKVKSDYTTTQYGSIFYDMLEAKSNYTTTQYGPCSSQCGEGTRSTTTIFCGVNQATSLSCDKNTTYEDCHNGVCQRKES